MNRKVCLQSKCKVKSQGTLFGYATQHALIDDEAILFLGSKKAIISLETSHRDDDFEGSKYLVVSAFHDQKHPRQLFIIVDPNHTSNSIPSFRKISLALEDLQLKTSQSFDLSSKHQNHLISSRKEILIPFDISHIEEMNAYQIDSLLNLNLNEETSSPMINTPTFNSPLTNDSLLIPVLDDKITKTNLFILTIKLQSNSQKKQWLHAIDLATSLRTFPSKKQVSNDSLYIMNNHINKLSDALNEIIHSRDEEIKQHEFEKKGMEERLKSMYSVDDLDGILKQHEDECEQLEFENKTLSERVEYLEKVHGLCEVCRLK